MCDSRFRCRGESRALGPGKKNNNSSLAVQQSRRERRQRGRRAKPRSAHSLRGGQCSALLALLQCGWNGSSNGSPIVWPAVAGPLSLLRAPEPFHGLISLTCCAPPRPFSATLRLPGSRFGFDSIYRWAPPRPGLRCICNQSIRCDCRYRVCSPRVRHW